MSLLATYSDGSIKYAVGENQFLVMNLDNHVTQVIEYSKIRLNKGFPPKILDNGEPQYINVITWQDGEIIDYGGLIEQQDELTVTINGMYYVKTACEFKVR
ncbi:hypothetical protein AB4Z21_27815 [Paenibacillus sp. MCAF20]